MRRAKAAVLVALALGVVHLSAPVTRAATVPMFQRAGIVVDVGPPGSFDGVYARFPAVLHETDGTYRMWYSGFDGYQNRILSAVSSDGIHWTKTGLVFNVGATPYFWDSVASESVMRIGAVYHMWFGAGFWSGGAFGYWAQIYHAVSTDALTWNVTGVALAPGAGWDAGMVNMPSVARNKNGTFWMAFMGWDGTRNRIGLASSPNGVHFAESTASPVIEAGLTGSWDSGNVESPDLLLNGTAWSLYYSGYNGTTAIGVAHSSDGLHWIQDPLNPVVIPAAWPAWDSSGVGHPDLLADSERMYYAGNNGTNVRIGLLTTTAGTGASAKAAGIPVTVLLGFTLVAGIGGLVLFTFALRPRKG